MTALRQAWRTLDTRPIEAVYCLLTISWGLSLLAPGDAMLQTKSFGPMLSVMPENAWGLLALTIGIVRTYGLVCGDVRARLVASLGGGFIWNFLAVTMLLSSGITTGVAVYGILANVNNAVFIKLCRTFGGPSVARP